MKLTCPCCGAIASLDVLLAHEGAREALLLAFRLPAPLGALLVRYLGLFRPDKNALAFDRVAKILGELIPLIEAGKFDRNHHTWAAPMEVWKIGLEAVLEKRDTLDLPLKGHGYLLEIMASKCSKVEAKAEQKVEEERKARKPRKEPESPLAAQAPAEFREALQALSGRGRAIDPDGDIEARRQSTLRALEEAQRTNPQENNHD